MIATTRLKILPWSKEHAEAFYHLTQDDGFMAFPITEYRQASLASAEEWLAKEEELFRATGLGKFGVWELKSGTLIGMGGLTPWELDQEKLVDLTYRFRRSAWGKGFGREAASALVDYAFKKLGLSEITATITPDNEASIRLAKTLGMKLDRRIVLKSVATDLYRLPRDLGTP